MRIVNQLALTRSLSFSTTITKNFNNLNRTNNTYKVKLESFNGQTWIKDKIIINTEASQCHCITMPTPIISAQNYSFITYDGRRTTLTRQSQIMIKTPESFLLEHDCYIDPTINNEYYHILLGMTFLYKFHSYEINPSYITLIDHNTKIILYQILNKLNFLCSLVLKLPPKTLILLQL